MADEIIEQQVVATPQPEQTEGQQEVAKMMAISLNGGIEPKPQEPITPTAEVQTQVQEPTFSFDLVKEKYGYENPETFFSEIEQLRALKENPPAPTEITFENETAKKLFEALKAGKSEEVYNYLDEQRRLENLTTSEVTKDTAADIVKLGMQLKYKDLTPDEINYKFNKQYGIPPKPIELYTDIEGEYEERVKTWEGLVSDRTMELMIEAKLAKPELEAAKSKLVLPEIEQAANPKMEAFNQYLKEIEDAEKIGEVAKKEFSSFTTKEAEIKVPFKDEANKIDFNFSFEPDEDGWKIAKEMAIDSDKFFSSYFDKDGNPNRKQYLEEIYFAKNKDKIIAEAIKQGKNAAIKALLPDNSGNQNRQIPQNQEQSEFDIQMKRALNMA